MGNENRENYRSIYEQGLAFAKAYATEVQKAESGKDWQPPVESEKIRIYGWIVSQLFAQMASNSNIENAKVEIFVLSQGCSSKARPYLETRFKQSYSPHYVLTEKQILEVLDCLAEQSAFKIEQLDCHKSAVALYCVTLK